MRTRQVALALIVVGAFVAAFPLTAQPRTGSSRATCLSVSRGLLSSLKGSLRAKARGKLGTPKAVKSGGRFGGLRDIREGPVYFVSARVRGDGIATWAVGGRAFKTGGGGIIGVSPEARRSSDAGADLPLGLLRAWHLTPAASGYAASRACIK